MLMQKNIKKPIEKVKAEKIESNPQSKMLQGLKYSISMDAGARPAPVIDQPKHAKQEAEPAKSATKKTSKTKLLNLLHQIKEHPEVLKLIHKI